MFDPSHFHPMLVHFPVALIITGFFVDLLSLFFNKKEPCLSRAGFYLMIFGTLGAVGGYLTGEFFTPEFSGEAGELKETHELFAKITMYVMIAACLIRIYLAWKHELSSKLKWVVFLLYFIATCSVGVTGLLGGSLVYNHMIGLELTGTEQAASQKVTNKTVDNLKAALQGETTASAKYAAFAQKADEENLPRIAALFRAASKSESMHIRNHSTTLKNLGWDITMEPEIFEVGTTLENLQQALKGETYEVETMYPGFIDQATKDDNSDALKTLGWARDTEKKHTELFKSAIDALNSKKDNSLPASYYVCPKCGFTYTSEDVEDYCELCGTEKEKFISIK